MARMVFLLQRADATKGLDEDVFHIQIGDHDDYETVNLTFTIRNLGPEPKVELKGFMIPTLGYDSYFYPWDSRESKTIATLVRILPKLQEKSFDLPEFIGLLAKKFKVTESQFNVNSNFDWSNTVRWDNEELRFIKTELKRANFPTDF